VRLDRLRSGEWLALGAAVALVWALVALPAQGESSALAELGVRDLLLLAAAAAALFAWLATALSSTTPLPVAGTACAGTVTLIAALFATVHLLTHLGSAEGGDFATAALVWIELVGLGRGLADERLGLPEDPRDHTGARASAAVYPRVERIPAPSPTASPPSPGTGRET